MSYKREIKKKDFIPNRDLYILKKSKNKTVVHIGATDSPFTREKFERGVLLFARLDEVVKKQIGIDIDEELSEYLNNQDFNNSKIMILDMNKTIELDFVPDIIIAGEVLEHLMNLEIALNNFKGIMNKKTKLIISVPNATYFMNLIYPFLGYEEQHPDHKVAFTYKTIVKLLKENDFEIVDLKFTWLKESIKILNWKGKLAFYISYPFSYFFPLFSGNILITVKKNK